MLQLKFEVHALGFKDAIRHVQICMPQATMNELDVCVCVCLYLYTYTHIHISYFKKKNEPTLKAFFARLFQIKLFSIYRLAKIFFVSFLS